MPGDTDKNDQNNLEDKSSEKEKNNQNEDSEKQKTVPHQAFHAEREARKEAEKKLKEYQDAEAERNKKAEEEKGNFKSLYEQEQTKNKDLESKLNETSGKLQGYESAMQDRINSQIESLKNKEDQEILKKLLDGKSLVDQETMLPTLLKKFGTPENINNAPSGSGEKESNDKDSKYEKAKKDGNTLSMIKNAPSINP